jgi:hypothetical protein
MSHCGGEFRRCFRFYRSVIDLNAFWANQRKVRGLDLQLQRWFENKEQQTGVTFRLLTLKPPWYTNMMRTSIAGLYAMTSSWNYEKAGSRIARIHQL